ncbi:MAG: hypothetical protein JXN61_12970, partial [Sedimentisphaerales bacterium]|nr:hypothetical protein [Sedimentisphaerales bacterium]
GQIMQNKPNLQTHKITPTSFAAKNYDKKPRRRNRKNKPNQTQLIAPKPPPKPDQNQTCIGEPCVEPDYPPPIAARHPTYDIRNTKLPPPPRHPTYEIRHTKYEIHSPAPFSRKMFAVLEDYACRDSILLYNLSYEPNVHNLLSIPGRSWP